MLGPVARRLREVTVRPTVGPSERNRWDALMSAHHYLPFRGLVGRSVRHVAVLGEHWLTLIGWHAGAFKLRARVRWLGWLPALSTSRFSRPEEDNSCRQVRAVTLPGSGCHLVITRVYRCYQPDRAKRSSARLRNSVGECRSDRRMILRTPPHCRSRRDPRRIRAVSNFGTETSRSAPSWYVSGPTRGDNRLN